MAGRNSHVLLGFEDEVVNDKNKHLLNFKTNKIGGKPDVPNNVNCLPTCTLCKLPQLLVVQIYAPMENSKYHRTLYVFACINPNCWNQSESWTCLRLQTEEIFQEEPTQFAPNIKWCADADDWDDDNANENEENGNIINPERISDEDEDSFSLDDSVRSTFGNLTVDDKNANTDAQGGAVGRQNSPAASAEIEGDEGEIITIDSPTMPQNNITTLLHEAPPLPAEICIANMKQCPDMYFTSSFISVWEETNSYNKISDKHVKELLQEYHFKENFSVVHAEVEVGRQAEGQESYEKSLPSHGDKMFHYFLSKIQKNPSQILRYSREVDVPLLLYPHLEVLKRCQYCQEERIFEFQILPTIIPKLRLNTDLKASARLEFGTALIYTCKNSCWTNDAEFREETVILQREI